MGRVCIRGSKSQSTLVRDKNIKSGIFLRKYIVFPELFQNFLKILKSVSRNFIYLRLNNLIKNEKVIPKD